MKKQLISTAKTYINMVNNYFGIENMQMAIWFYGGLTFPTVCFIIAILAKVVIK
ncbi:hypothetical protein AB6878_12925 [Carnobacterium maltaromaticum]|uniref:hypothetical protein n=1 Tax=Carnobacterium maltaromaticum TaxID=2751 RepID=UPI0039BDB251